TVAAQLKVHRSPQVHGDPARRLLLGELQFDAEPPHAILRQFSFTRSPDMEPIPWSSSAYRQLREFFPWRNLITHPVEKFANRGCASFVDIVLDDPKQCPFPRAEPIGDHFADLPLAVAAEAFGNPLLGGRRRLQLLLELLQHRLPFLEQLGIVLPAPQIGTADITSQAFSVTGRSRPTPLN